MLLILVLLLTGVAAQFNHERQVQELCPTQCECNDKRNDVTVQCKLTNKGYVPTVLPPRTKHLDLSGNSLYTLEATNFQNPNMTGLRSLDLSHCSLKTLGRHLFVRLKNLRSVHLNDNQLSEKEARTLLMDSKSLLHVHFHLDGNLFDCFTFKKRYQKWNIVCDPGRTRKTTDNDISSNSDSASVTEGNTEIPSSIDDTDSVSIGHEVTSTVQTSWSATDATSTAEVDLATSPPLSPKPSSATRTISEAATTLFPDANDGRRPSGGGIEVLMYLSFAVLLITVMTLIIVGLTIYCVRQRRKVDGSELTDVQTATNTESSVNLLEKDRA